MRHLLSRVLALVVTLSISMGSSASMSGNEFQTLCTYETATYDAGMCMGYLQAVHEVHESFAALTELNRFYCSPDSVTYGQGKQISLKYLEENPEILHRLAAQSIILALAKAFPCEDDQ